MRIVERTKNKKSVQYQLSKMLGIAAGIFSLVVCLLMIANNLSIKASDPIHLPALDRMLEDLKTRPDDIGLKEQIRELDYLRRKAFFTSKRANQMGIYLLLGGLIVMVTCFKWKGSVDEEAPLPDGTDVKDDIIKDAMLSRYAIGGTGLIMVGFALFLAFSSQSQITQLDAADAENNTFFASDEEMRANWPNFRGADGNGYFTVENPPTQWNAPEGKGILWKTKIPKPGFNSPILWGDKLFLSGGDDEAHEVYCVDANTGKILWTRQITDIKDSPEKMPKVTSDTGHAAAGMATDGHSVFAIFSTGNVVALDFEGNQLWGRNLGVPNNPYGHCSSLVTFEDLLLIQFDHEDEGRFMGLETRTGRTRWESHREFGTSWSSPLLTKVDGEIQAILSANPMVVSYNPRNGKELWRLDCLGGEVAPTPVLHDGMIFVAADYIKIAAINAENQEVVWHQEVDIPGVSTPLLVNGLFIAGLSDAGISCRDAKTGEELWFEETDDGFYASPVLVGNNVYMMDRGGTMHIFAAEREFKRVGTAVLDEQSVATPVFADGAIYYRSYENLFRIGA